MDGLDQGPSTSRILPALQLQELAKQLGDVGVCLAMEQKRYIRMGAALPNSPSPRSRRGRS